MKVYVLSSSATDSGVSVGPLINGKIANAKLATLHKLNMELIELEQ